MNNGYRPRYKSDFLIRLLFATGGSYLVTQYGGTESLVELLLTPVFYVEFFVTLAIALFILQIIYTLTRVLDKRFDWHGRLLWRIPLQALLGILTPTIVTFLLAACYFAYYDRNILKTNYHIYALPFIVLLYTIVNIYYYLRYLLEERAFYHHHHHLTLIPSAQQPTSPSGARDSGMTFIARTPTRSFPIPYKEIAYFFRSGTAVYLRTTAGQDHLLAQSLDTIETKLDRDRFFRVARYMICNIDAVQEFSDEKNQGKLILTLNPPYAEQVTVSKLLAKRFKAWMQRQQVS